MHTRFIISATTLSMHIISHYYRNESGTSGDKVQKLIENSDFPHYTFVVCIKVSSGSPLLLVVTKPKLCASHQALYICRTNNGVNAALLILCHLCYWSVGRRNYSHTQRDTERCSRINFTAALHTYFYESTHKARQAASDDKFGHLRARVPKILTCNFYFYNNVLRNKRSC
jgi:hypothetical protein